METKTQNAIAFIDIKIAKAEDAYTNFLKLKEEVDTLTPEEELSLKQEIEQFKNVKDRLKCLGVRESLEEIDFKDETGIE